MTVSRNYSESIRDIEVRLMGLNFVEVQRFTWFLVKKFISSQAKDVGVAFKSCCGHMDDAVLNSEGPLPLESRGHPSEQTEHQSSEKVNNQTSPKQVHLILCLMVLLLHFCCVWFYVHFGFCSKRGNYEKENRREMQGRRMKNNDNIQKRH